ncbi:uncharacterized protein K441DRAFT_7795 [Cenococcum geophilum 1.58]|uniref:uncharacterized protein n=1 Tax=Cenococcum geophilum 1.58 TaxID=794803 RepID=UPI00358E2704|nr:hypothetical protein K441DRAFT_7795 [Cenococcum geophilum 1.58]
MWRMPFGGCLFSLVDSLGNSRSSIKYLQSPILTLNPPKKALKYRKSPIRSLSPFPSLPPLSDHMTTNYITARAAKEIFRNRKLLPSYNVLLSVPFRTIYAE